MPVTMILVSGGMRWLIRLGGPGLILLALADNSLIPLPGSMDVATIWLAASHRNLWFYYSFMATAGAVLGGYLTYRIAFHGGKAALEKKVSRKTADRVYRKFRRWGFGAVFVPAMLPPPFPIVPALLAAGALQYPRKRFLAALALGRGVRFTILGFLGAHYGPRIVNFFSRYYRPALVILISLAVIGGGLVFAQFWRIKRQDRNSRAGSAARRAA